MQRNQLRIIGGQWRGRLLRFPDHPQLRPTGDRTRETLFNWLGPDLSQTHCIDLFSGSGALAFEAASRQAPHVLAFELATAAVQQLRKSRLALQAATVEIWQNDALKWLRQSPERRFDLIFADPPFSENLLPSLLPLLDKRLHPGGLLYIEAAALPTLPAGWSLYKQSKIGKVFFALLHHISDPSA